MAGLNAPVGQGEKNEAADVRQVQQLLNLQAKRLGFAPLAENGVFDGKLVEAIGKYQQGALGMRQPTGSIAPGDRTFTALSLAGMSGDAARRAADAQRRAQLSGKAWFQAHEADYPNSDRIADLTPAFGAQVRDFIAALEKAGAGVTVSATLRNADRAFVMHWAWQVANGAVKASAVPRNPKVPIEWDHGTDADSRAAAKEMVALFHIAFQPSLTSRHIEGRAIDMTITWTQPIRVLDRDGHETLLDQPRSGATNDVLHRIGRSYGVIKLLTDPPHWSTDGH